MPFSATSQMGCSQLTWKQKLGKKNFRYNSYASLHHKIEKRKKSTGSSMHWRCFIFGIVQCTCWIDEVQIAHYNTSIIVANHIILTTFSAIIALKTDNSKRWEHPWINHEWRWTCQSSCYTLNLWGQLEEPLIKPKGFRAS